MSDAQPKLVTVTLLKPHTHKGIQHIAGAKIDLRPDQADRLIKAEVAQKGDIILPPGAKV